MPKTKTPHGVLTGGDMRALVTIGSGGAPAASNGVRLINMGYAERHRNPMGHGRTWTYRLTEKGRAKMGELT